MAQTETNQALARIRSFLRETTCYAILPESFRLIVLDNDLTVKKALTALTLNAVASAPLYDTTSFKFAGMLTYTDFIHLIQYYYNAAVTYDSAASDVEQVKLSNLRGIEKSIGVPPPPTVSIHPDNPLLDAAAALVRTHARRIPLVDIDDATGKETILSVLTQYRLLKFIAINCTQECASLTASIGELGIGTYTSSYQLATGSQAIPLTEPAQRRARSRSIAQQASSRPPSSADPSPTPSSLPQSESPSQTPSEGAPDRFHPLATATLDTTVFDVVHLFSEMGISGVPIVNPTTGEVINLYESIDVVDLVKDDAYRSLDLTIEQALARRSANFPGVMCCTPQDSLANIMALIRETRVHRLVLVEPGTQRIVGMLTLSDIAKHIVGRVDLMPIQLRGLLDGSALETDAASLPDGDTSMTD